MVNLHKLAIRFPRFIPNNSRNSRMIATLEESCYKTGLNLAS